MTVAALALLASRVLATGSLSAQDYPTKPITLIVPWPAGGPTDVAMRAIAEVAQKHLGQPIIIENKAGGAGRWARRRWRRRRSRTATRSRRCRSRSIGCR